MTTGLGTATASAIEAEYEAGARAVRLRFPTGWSKNAVLAAFIAEKSRKGPCLAVVPVGLKDQFHEDLKRADPDIRVGDWGSGFPVELASPLSAGSRASGRSPDTFVWIVVDECHAANAPSIRMMTEHFSGARILEGIAMPKPHPGVVEVDADIDAGMDVPGSPA